MPIDFSKLPDQKPAGSGVDFSGLPDQHSPDESSNHPYWAAATRIGGGVLSALTQPLEVTGFGTAVPAAISGGAEALAEKLEGSDLSPARIATEAALGAVPFGYLTKAGRLGKFLGQTGASMAKAGTIAGVGEGAREISRGEDLSPWSIGGQALLGAGTYGLLSRFLHGSPKAPTAPKTQYEVVPTAQEGGSVLSGKSVKGQTRMTVKTPPPIEGSPTAAPIKVPPFGTRMAGLVQPPQQPITGAEFASEGVPSTVGGPAAKSAAAEAKLAQEAKLASDADLARKQAGLVAEDPTAAQTLSGVDPATGRRYTFTQRFAASNEEGGNISAVPGEPTPPSTASVMPVEPPPTAPAPEPVAPPTEPPQSPLARVLRTPRKRTSVRTPEGFQAAVDANLAKAGERPVTEASNGGNAAPPAAPAEPLAPIAPVEPQNAPGTTNEPPPDSPLGRIFKTRTGQTGHAYGMAKKTGITGEELARIRDEHLVALGREPEGIAGLEVPTPETVEVPPDLGTNTRPASHGGDGSDWVQKQLDDINALQAPMRFDDETGAINPKFLKIGAPITGAVIGGPVGEYLDPEDPNAAVKGALTGAALGYGATNGFQGLINARNAGLLATLSAQFKKPLSDFGAYLAKMAETPVPGQTRAMAKELFNPVNLKNAAAAFKNPDLAQDVIGDSARSAIPPSTGLMRLITRPFAAAQYATSQAMERAGVSPEEARNVLFLGKPNYPLFQKWLDLQKLEGSSGKVVRAVRPFARIGTNIFERGMQRIPGLGYIAPKFDAAIGGDPQTKLARTLLGGAAIGAGALVGSGDTQDEELGNEPLSPLVRGLRRAALASYGIPFMLGESLTGPRGIRDLLYATPGATQTVPVPAPKDTLWSYAKKFGKRWSDQTVPDWLAPSTNTDAGIR